MAERTESDSSPFPSPLGNVVYEQQLVNYKIQIVIADDEMSASVSLHPEDANEALIDAETLLNTLSQHGVVDGIDMVAIKTFCLHACKGKKQDNVVIAATLPPQPGDNGWIEPLIRTEKDTDNQFNEDETGRLDLYTLNLFTTVEPEQQIAILHPPELGKASSTVTGKEMPPVSGKDVDIRLGTGVRLEDDGTSFIAEISGRAELTESIISISEDYIVHGDVDLTVGNINFPGTTRVSGDVLDSFDIRSLKGIEVTGAVGACHLISDGDITIGSMSGRNDGLIRCGGNLTANYLNGVTVECMGTVTVRNEIRNCTIKSAEIIMVKDGVISGGNCTALRGIETKDVGADAGATTKLRSGVYFPEEDQLKTLKTQQKSITIQNQFIKRSMGPLGKLAKKDTTTTEAIKTRLKILLERQELLKVKQQKVEQQLNSFAFREHDSNAKINVHRRLKQNVVISLDTVTEEGRLEHHGPLSVVADASNGILRFCDMSPLNIRAEEAE
ncbi:MAG: FapA family protein [Thermodesulfobacteriota bacterium]|nr:FapA family protein [Thermodesulfobacteriota bacterium]